MKVSCPKCPAKYAIPAEKVAGRRIRLHCKKCGSPIYIDGTTSPPTASDRPPTPTGAAFGQVPALTSRPPGAGDSLQPVSSLEHGTSEFPGETAPSIAALGRDPHAENVVVPASARDGRTGVDEPATAALDTADELGGATLSSRRGAGPAASDPPPIPPSTRTSPRKPPSPVAPPPASGVPASAAQQSISPERPAKPASALRGGSHAPRTQPSRGSAPPTPSRAPGSARTSTSPRRGLVEPPRKPASSAATRPPKPAAVVPLPKVDAPPRVESPLRRTLLGGLEPAAGSAPGSAAPSQVQDGGISAWVWLVALNEELQEEKTTAQIIALYLQKIIDAETVVWRDGMEQWQGLFEVPELLKAFSARGIHPPQADLTSPGSGVRDVAAAPPSLRAEVRVLQGESIVPAVSRTAEDPAGDNLERSVAAGPSPANMRGADEPSSKPASEADEDATVALEAETAHQLLPAQDGAFFFGPNEEDIATRLLPFERFKGSEPPAAPLPAAGRPAYPSAAMAPSFPAPPSTPPAVTAPSVPAALPQLAPPEVDLAAPAGMRGSRWVVALAILVAAALLLAIVSRLV